MKSVGIVTALTFDGIVMMPLPKSAFGTGGTPSAVRPAQENAFGALTIRLRRTGWFVRIGRASEYGSLVMPNPPRSTVVGDARNVTPSRGANSPFSMLMPRSIGTEPMPPISIMFVSGL